MNKKWKKIIIILVVLILSYFLVNYLMFKAGEYLFKTEIVNAEEVTGKTDNNNLGIRNDVYDVIQKEYVLKMNLNERQKIVVYNLAYIVQKELENFTNESEIIKYKKLSKLLFFCEYEKYGELIGEMVQEFKPYSEQKTNTNERKLALRIVDSIYVKHWE